MPEKAWRNGRDKDAAKRPAYDQLGGSKDWCLLYCERLREMPLTVPCTPDEIAAFDPKHERHLQPNDCGAEARALPRPEPLALARRPASAVCRTCVCFGGGGIRELHEMTLT